MLTVSEVWQILDQIEVMLMNSMLDSLFHKAIKKNCGLILIHDFILVVKVSVDHSLPL